MPVRLSSFLIILVTITLGSLGSAFAEQPARGYQARLCGLDMDRDGTIGEPEDCNVCTSDILNSDPDGDGDNEDIIYVSCAKGATASRPAGVDDAGCGQTPGNPCLTIAHAWANEADGVGDGNHEDIVCFRNICVEESLTPVHSGEPTTYQMPSTPSEAQPWVRGSNPAMLIGWDSDGDNAYPPEDSDDVAIIEPQETCPDTPNLPCTCEPGDATCVAAPILNPTDSRRRFYQKNEERAFSLGGGIDNVELAHFTVRDFGRFTLTNDSGFIEFSVQGNSHIDIHDLHLNDINRHGNFTSGTSTINMFGFRANHVRFENILFSNNGHWLARGDGGDGPTSGDGGPYGPTRWQNITVKANACWAKQESRCVREIHCPVDQFPEDEYPNGCCSVGPICIADDPADCEPGPEDVCNAQFTTNWKLWGYLSGIEIIDSVIDTNLTDRDNVDTSMASQRAIDMAQCSQDWTIRNNELIDWSTPFEVAPHSNGFCDAPGIARDVDNIIIDKNIVDTRRWWGSGKRAIKLKEGGNAAGQSVRNVTITNNILKTSNFWDGCFQIESGNDGVPIEGTIIFANNTCQGRLGAIGVIAIGALNPSNNQANMPQDIVIRNNIVSGITGDNNVWGTYEPTALDMDFNVFDGDGNYRWNNATFTTLAAWQTASGGDTNSSECDPTYVDAASGDFHLDPSDVCALDKGTPVAAAVVADIDLDERGQGSGWDIGADEVPNLAVPEANLALTARAIPASASVGGTVRYLLMVTNIGPDTAPDVNVTTTLPTGLSYVGDTCSAGPPVGGVWTWSLDSVTINATSRIRPRCLITLQATQNGAQTIVTMVTSSGDDPNGANNTSDVTVTIE